jgi:hypothetical protein
VEQDSFRFNRPGDKNYAPPTGPYAAPPTRGEWDDVLKATSEKWDFVLKATYEPNFKIPYLEMRVSAMDIISLLSNFLPGGPVISLLLDATNIGYFYRKNDKYEMGLRVIFLALPFRQLPIVRKWGQEKLTKLIILLSDIGKDYKILGKLAIEEIRNIIYLFKFFIENRNTIILALKQSRLFAIALARLVGKLSALSAKQILVSLHKLYKINPKNGIFVKGGKLLLNITTMLGEGYFYIKTWDALWNKFAPEKWVDEKIILDTEKRMDLQKELLSTLTKVSENEINQYYNNIKS